MRRALFLSLLQLAACRSPSTDPHPHSDVPERAPRPAAVSRDSLLSAEQRRDSAAIGRDALSSRDPSLRRAAARALARIADARAAELLPLALSDEDPEVSTWGAYGLGFACHGREGKAVHALIARAASLANSSSSVESASMLASPIEAIGDALGRCGGAEAESTLRAWLGGPTARAESAALGLGRLVEHTGKLDDATLVALLDAADRAPSPLHNALFPITRLAMLNASTGQRVLRLAVQLLAEHGPSAELALRALGRAGEPGRAALSKLLDDVSVAPGLRAEAVRELATQAVAGQRPLWTAFDATNTKLPSDADLSGENYGPFSALLDALEPPTPSSSAKLLALAELPIDGQDSQSLKRRKVHVRCTAAALLAGSNFQYPRLLACDAGSGSDSLQRELAVLAVMGRERLRGTRKQAYLQRAGSGEGALREAALEQLGQHAELSEAYRLLAEALASKSLGVVATAAHVLSRYPQRAERAERVGDASGNAASAPNPDPSVVRALGPAYAAARTQNSVEVQSLLLDAIGALQSLSLKESVNAACSSDNPTLREHAGKALHLLGEQLRQCDEFVPSTDSNARGTRDQPALLTLETDAGTLSLTLDPRFAPNAVTRIVALAQSGFYDGMAVHRVVPGFVAQFGDPAGDGYGGDGQPALRCETSPVAFLTGGVGIALSGRDTGSSQLFVTLGRYPHLDGQYAWIGQAGPGWDRLAAGDRIVRARVSAVP